MGLWEYFMFKYFDKGMCVMGKFRILISDITSAEILKNHDLIINPTNPRMVCGMGISGAIFHAANVEKLENYTQSTYNISYFTEDNLMEVGEVRITPGFDLRMDIMFVQGPKFYDYEYDVAMDKLFKTYKNMLEEIENNNYKNILCPSLGTGHYGFLHEEVGHKIVKLIMDFIKDKDINIDLVLYDESDKVYYN